MYHLEGIREGVLVLPTGKKVPLNIDCIRYDYGEMPDIRVSIAPGPRGRYLVEEYESMVRAKNFLAKPFIISEKPTIKKVIFNDPATIVIWSDDTKTVVKCQPGDTYSKELGLAMCISKKFLGNKGNFNDEFKKWIPEEETRPPKREDISLEEMSLAIRNFCRGHGCNECPIFRLPGRDNSSACSHDIADIELIENYNAINDFVWRCSYENTGR